MASHSTGKTKKSAIAIAIVTTLFTACGSIFFKLGADRLTFSITGLLTNYWLILGGIAYFIGFMLLNLALKGGELSVIYPTISLSYIWVILISVPVFHEDITLGKTIGALCILTGAFLIGKGSKP